LIPRRVRLYCKTPLTKYFRVLIIQPLGLPVLTLQSEYFSSELCYEEPRCNTAEILNYMDTPVAFSYEDLSYFSTSRAFFKEKYDGRPLMAMLDSRGVQFFSIADGKVQETPYGISGIFCTDTSCRIFLQYELVGEVLHLCSVNAIVRNNAPLAVNFYHRQMMLPLWFRRVWKPLNLLRLPVQFKEGIIVQQSESCSVSYQHHAYDRKWYKIGSSRWCKAVPTVDVRTVGGGITEVDVASYLNGREVQFVRRRYDRSRPNDGARLEHIYRMVPVEAIVAIGQLNGSLKIIQKTDLDSEEVEEVDSIIPLPAWSSDPVYPDFKTKDVGFGFGGFDDMHYDPVARKVTQYFDTTEVFVSGDDVGFDFMSNFSDDEHGGVFDDFDRPD